MPEAQDRAYAVGLRDLWIHEVAMGLDVDMACLSDQAAESREVRSGSNDSRRSVPSSASNRHPTQQPIDDAAVVELDFADSVRPLIPRWWSALLDDVGAAPDTSVGMGRLVIRSTGSTWALSTARPAFARCPAATPVAIAQLAELAPVRAGVLEPGGWLVLYPATGPAVRTRVAGGIEPALSVPAIPAAS